MPVRRGSKLVHLTILSEQMLGKYSILAFHSFLRTSVTLVKCTRSSLSLGFQCWCFTVLECKRLLPAPPHPNSLSLTLTHTHTHYLPTSSFCSVRKLKVTNFSLVCFHFFDPVSLVFFLEYGGSLVLMFSESCKDGL